MVEFYQIFLVTSRSTGFFTHARKPKKQNFHWAMYFHLRTETTQVRISKESLFASMRGNAFAAATDSGTAAWTICQKYLRERKWKEERKIRIKEDQENKTYKNQRTKLTKKMKSRNIWCQFWSKIRTWEQALVLKRTCVVAWFIFNVFFFAKKLSNATLTYQEAARGCIIS